MSQLYIKRRQNIKRIGRRGENAAVALLRQKYYDILCRNYRRDKREIDIVAMDGATLVFVEVKTQREKGRVRPGERVSREQKKRIRSAAKTYMREIGNPPLPYRFDVVEVKLDSWLFPCEICHWLNDFDVQFASDEDRDFYD